MPANCHDMVVQRVVVRNGYKRDLAEMLVRDIRRHLNWFAAQVDLRSRVQASGFNH
jgi:glutamate decarboxylase